MNKKIFLAILFGTILFGSNLFANASYAAIGSSQDKVSYTGKVNVSSLPKSKNQPHHFTMPFLPKSQSSYIESKSKPKSIKLNNTTSMPAARMLAPTVSIIKEVQIISQFDGLDQSQCNCSPPDVQIAVGPDHIVEMVNTSEEVWQKQSQPVTTVSLYDFYSVAQSDFLSDPRIFFDSESNRWFASILDVSTDSVKVAVSDTSDPTKNWNIYNISFGANCPDQPAIAVNDDKLVVSANDFANCLTNPTLVGAQYFVIDKSQLIQGSPNPSMESFGPDITEFSIMPAKSLGSTSTLYMVSAYGSTSTLRLYSIGGSVPNATPHTKNLTIHTINIPPGAAQKGTSIDLETNDDRILDAVWHNGNLWLVLTDSCTPIGDSEARSCVRVIEIDTRMSSIVQDFDLGTSGMYYFYPAITVDGNGDLDMIFGYSSASSYPGLMFATQTPADSTGQTEPIQILKTGAAPDTSGRYGDYFGAALDPTNTTNVFVAGEFHSVASSSSPWATFIGSTAYVKAPEFPFAIPIFIAGVIFLLAFQRVGNKKREFI